MIGMACMSVCWSSANISTALSMKCTDIHVSRRMYHDDFGNPLRPPLYCCSEQS